MERLIFAIAFLVFFTGVSSAQSTSSTWIDITSTYPSVPYNAPKDCSGDASAAINAAITNATPAPGKPATGFVIFFPTGCYLINSRILDVNTSAAALTYLGFGNVELRAGTASGSIIQFGNDSTTVSLRKVVNLKFNCYSSSIDGIDLDGLVDSEFDDVDIRACRGSSNWHLRTVGNNANNYSNVYIGGVIVADASDANGVSLGANLSTPSYEVTNAWTFIGTKILGYGSTPTGMGLDFEGAGSSLSSSVVSNWGTGVALVSNNTSSVPRGGFQISGNYIENNQYFGIRVGAAGTAGSLGAGVNIAGNYVNCNGLGQTGISLQQAKGFSITGNHIKNCTSNAIISSPDSTNQGADCGFVGANFIDGGQPVLLQGSNSTVASSISSQSSAYTLKGTDSWVNVSGTTTITVPNNLIGQRWDVFNSGSGTLTLACYSGTINGSASVSLSAGTGKTVTTDGTNCFAH